MTLTGCGPLPPSHQTNTPKSTPSKPKSEKKQHNILAANQQINEQFRQEIILYAMGLLDNGYKWGGNKPEEGLDCSGLVNYIYFNAVKMQLPRTASLLANAGNEIPFEKIKAGDLVFFNTRGFDNSHVGIYLGNNQFIHAPNENQKIKLEKIQGYYKIKLTKVVSFISS